MRSLPFLSFVVPIVWWNVPLMFPVFLKRSLVFPLLLFSSIFKHCSLKKAFLSLLAIFWNSAFNCMYPSLLPKGDQSWVFIGRTDAEAETPVPWPPHAKS